MRFSPLLLCSCLLLFNSLLYAQEAIDQTNNINGLELSSSLESLKHDLQLITGNETVFQNNPFLAKNVKRNLEVGIQEGIYLGHTLRIVNGNTAHDLRLIYLSGSLFKCRWTFDRNDLPNLQDALKTFVSYFTKKFGPPTETQFNDTFIWKGEVNRLMINSYDGTIQIEWRNEASENISKRLLQEK